MNKKLSKEIMRRSCLRNKFLNTRSKCLFKYLHRKPYNKQKNYVVTLLRKEKFFYSNLNTNILTENRTFWKTVKPFLTDKTNKTSRITLIEEERVISQDYLIAKTFSKYFINIPIKNKSKIQEYESIDSSEGNPVTSIIKKY